MLVRWLGHGLVFRLFRIFLDFNKLLSLRFFNWWGRLIRNCLLFFLINANFSLIHIISFLFLSFYDFLNLSNDWYFFSLVFIVFLSWLFQNFYTSLGNFFRFHIRLDLRSKIKSRIIFIILIFVFYYHSRYLSRPISTISILFLDYLFNNFLFNDLLFSSLTINFFDIYGVLRLLVYGDIM